MNQIEPITIRNLHEKVLHRQKQWAWHNGLPLKDSLRRLLNDPMYCEKFGRFLAEVADCPIRSRAIGWRLCGYGRQLAHRTGLR